MKGFYDILSRLIDREEILTITGVDGEYLGVKEIYQAGKLIYSEGTKYNQEAPVDICRCTGLNGLIKDERGTFFYEKISEGKELVICGGGHVANAVIRAAAMLDFSITVVEDREEFADQAKSCGAGQVLCMPFEEGLQQIKFHKNTYCLIMTRGHLHDRECLKYLLTCTWGYAGLLGSRKRVGKLKEELLREGYQKEKLDKIHMPVGLPISANSPAEIAISILGEIISVKNQSGFDITYEKPVAKALFEKMLPGEKQPFLGGVLVTVIEKCGSAPRNTGTKMIVCPDGRILGTVGGGYLEAESIRCARDYFENKEKERKTASIRIASEQAALEGMHCGGEVRLLLELVT